jgi:hypothetical protein
LELGHCVIGHFPFPFPLTQSILAPNPTYRMKRGTKSIPLLILCVLFQGCVGIDVEKTENQVYQNPHISNSASALGLKYPGASKTNSFVCTTTWLEEHWGKPSRITRNQTGNQTETWTYKFGLIWNGVTPIVLVPVPLIVPVGREQIHFVIQDGHVVSAKSRTEQSFICGYGLTPGPCASFGAFFIERITDATHKHQGPSDSSSSHPTSHC